MTTRVRHLRASLAVVTLAALVAGCSSNTPSGTPSQAYVLGRLDGSFASAFEAELAPAPWTGETDRPLLMSGSTLLHLIDAERDAVRRVLVAGQPVIVTTAGPDEVSSLYSIGGMPAALRLDERPTGQQHLEVHGLALPGGKIRGFSAIPWSLTDRAEPDADRTARVIAITEWIGAVAAEGEVPALRTSSAVSGSQIALTPSNSMWSQTVNFSMGVYWGTCGEYAQTCTNSAQYSLMAWPVYNAYPLAGQPTDYFVMLMNGYVSTEGCARFYGDKHNSQRIAGYWLRHVDMIASPVVPSSMTANDLSVMPGYAPTTTNPLTTLTTGITWSIGGGVTVGCPPGSAECGVTLQGTGGVGYTNSQTTTYQALSTTSNVGAGGPAAAEWSYDSWAFVSSSIEPRDHACPNGLDANATPPIIYGGTFQPEQNWVLAAGPSVRQYFTNCTAGSPGCSQTAPALPITTDLDLLLGWTFYAGGQICSGPGPVYDLPAEMWTGVTGTGPTAGIVFDVSCNATTNFGTIPLGPWTSGQNNDIGNPGTPWSPGAMAWTIPFALVPLQPVLQAISPTSGQLGQTVTFTGSNLGYVTAVDFGAIVLGTGTGWIVDTSDCTVTPANPTPDPTTCAKISMPVPNGLAASSTVSVSVAGIGPYGPAMPFQVLPNPSSSR